MTDFIRRIVSCPKARFQDRELGLDLDLVYVTDQIIIMGYPAAGLEGLYRNRREDAKRFLDNRHGKNYWVFNFCPIRENSYESSVFEGRVSRFPFPDHHVPPLALLPLLAREMHVWLGGSSERVAVLHCKAGKGRSGTMACTYLLTLDSPPTSPSLDRSLSAMERAKLHMGETIKELPEDDHTLNTPHSKPDLLDLDKSNQVPSDTAGIIDNSSLLPPLPSPLPSANSEKSFIDSLKGVLDLHTARRMKPSNDPLTPAAKQKKQRKGVSIPSQRRWLYYWALLLAGDAPKDIFNHTKNGGEVQKSSKPKVKVTRIQVRMREGSGVVRSVVHATNVVINTANNMKSSTNGKSASTSTEPAVKNKDDANQLWASIARYDDELIDALEKWEAWTRDEKVGIALRQKGSKHMTIGDIQHELDELFDASGKWDTSKMVHSFAKFGLRGVEDQSVTTEEGSKSKIYAHSLSLLSDKRWRELKNRVESTPNKPKVAISASLDAQVKELEKDMQRLDIPRSEATSMYEEPLAGRLPSNSSEEPQDLVVDASRELRVKLYVGKVFIGWFWFIPSFHMPQPPPASGSAGAESTKSTLHLSRKDLDFALGLGAAILDVDVDMEWVPQPPIPDAIPVTQLDEALPVKSDNRADSLETAEGQGSVGAVLQAVAGGMEGISDAIKVGQAGSV